MLQYSQTQSVAEFKQTYGIKSFNLNRSANNKPFFTTDNGIEGLVSTKSIDALKAGQLANIRISFVEDDETGRSGWMLHNVQSSEGATVEFQF